MTNTIVLKDLLQKKTIKLLDKRLVAKQWSNSEYEGELKKQGDTVTVQTFPNVTWLQGGTAGEDITEQDFAITSENLTVDQVAQINIPIKNIEEIQSNLNLQSEVANRMAYNLADIYDNFVFTTASAGAGTSVTTAALSASNIYAEIEKMRVALSENNAFDQAALFVRPEVSTLIRQSPVFDGFREGAEARMNGYVGKISGFVIFESNNVPAGEMIAWDKMSVHFVDQMTKMDVREVSNAFRYNMLGESVYGAKVFNENAKRIVKHPYTLA